MAKNSTEGNRRRARTRLERLADQGIKPLTLYPKEEDHPDLKRFVRMRIDEGIDRPVAFRLLGGSNEGPIAVPAEADQSVEQLNKEVAAQKATIEALNADLADEREAHAATKAATEQRIAVIADELAKSQESSRDAWKYVGVLNEQLRSKTTENAALAPRAARADRIEEQVAAWTKKPWYRKRFWRGPLED